MTDERQDGHTDGRAAEDPRLARLHELMGAALGGDLDAAERAELEHALADDPAARAELERADALARRLAGTGLQGWASAEPDESLRRRVLSATTSSTKPPRQGVVVPLRRRVSGALVAAACLVVLLGGGAGGFGLARWLERPVEGPPGTLGAQEPVAFTGAPAGVDVDASVVAHTWGTETVFEEISGLTPGRTYDVVLVAEDGTEISSGSFQAVTGAVNCRMTSAVLREDVAAISVRSGPSAEVMRSALPVPT